MRRGFFAVVSAIAATVLFAGLALGIVTFIGSTLDGSLDRRYRQGWLEGWCAAGGKTVPANTLRVTDLDASRCR